MYTVAFYFLKRGENIMENKISEVKKFLNDVEEITNESRKLGYTENGVLEILKIYFSKKSVGEY